MKIHLRTIGACGALCAALGAATATADIIPIANDAENSEFGIGEFTGSIDYDAGSATLIITLTNTSNPANGGFLTGFAFNIDSADGSASATLTSSTHPGMTGFMNQEASPFGMFLAGAATGGDWTGASGPSNGIAVNDTGVFEFSVSASDAASLSAVDFILAGPGDFGFVVRFHGFEDEGSDKVPALIVPGPGPLALLFAGGVIGLSRRRRN